MDITKVIIADDHPLVRDSIALLLRKQSDFEVIGQAENGEDAVKLVGELSPHVIIMDIEMPKMDGLEATRQIKAAHPEVSVLVLTVHDDDEYVSALLDAGAAGYMLKSVYGEELIQAIRTVRLGEFVLGSQVGHQILKNLGIHSEKEVYLKTGGKLSAREVEVLKLVARGMSNNEITNSLDITLRTVKGHLVDIFSKLGVGSRTEAIITSLRSGILSIEDLKC